jgi:hypothetical protein
VSAAAGLGPDVDGVVDFPWEVLEYLTWLRQQPSSRDTSRNYLFDEPEVRFAVAETDVLSCDAGARLGEASASGGLRLSSPRAPGGVLLSGVSEAERSTVLDVLRLLDGQLALGAVRAQLPAQGAPVLEALLRDAFGKLVFAPLAVLEAERAIAGLEITRFPGSPYEVARPFWKNMAAVRARSGALFNALRDDESFLRELRKLHVVALMGDDLATYYQPASPISSGRAAPGRLMSTRSELLETPSETLFVSGPRVHAALLGGARYHELLYRTLGEPEAAAPRDFHDGAGVPWGRLVHARAARDAAAAPWFCPPRPILPAHVRALRDGLAAAERAAHAADRSACSRELALFHRHFVRLHPFHCGNQCLAMNLINGVASRAFGAGLPHLMLDHLALRLSPGAYVRVFQRAVAAYADPQPDIITRTLRLASNRARTFALVRQLDAAPSLEAAWELARSDGLGRSLLLLGED